MKYASFLLTCMILISLSNSHANSTPGNCDLLLRADVVLVVPPPLQPPDELVYDDGTAHWLTWGGLYRGTWFDPTDFIYPILDCEVEGMEFWFYHHPEYPWDTSSFYAELWQGGISAPVHQLVQTQLVATHYSPAIAVYSPAISSMEPFWGLVNLEMSTGGWPSTLGDNTPNFTVDAHSFVSEDFIVWEPWIGGETGSNLVSFENNSWGSIKGLYR